MEVNNALVAPSGTDAPAVSENPGQTAKASKPKGRPKASSEGGEKRGRGRPKKSESSSVAKDQKSEAIEILAESLRKAGETISPNLEDLQFSVAGGPTSSGGEGIPKAKRPRGRPRKNPDQPPKPKPPLGDGPKRGRGRPRKNENRTVGRPRKRPLEEAGDEEPPKKPRTDGDSEGADNSNNSNEAPLAAKPPAPTESELAQPPKKKPGRPKKDVTSSANPQNGTSDNAGVKKRGRPPKNPSGRPRGRPKKAAQETTDGDLESRKLQVSFSDSESEESEALGKGAKQSGTFPAFSEPQASEAAGASGGAPLHPAAREPGFLNKFDESFDEDSDN